MSSKNNFYITSNDFSSFCDFVYSDRVEFNHSGFEDVEILEKSEDPTFSYVIYKKIKFQIANNDTVFCNSNQLDNLFYHLRKTKKLQNINLVSHQTDLLVTKKLFKTKPNCINKWFAVNVDYKHKNLIPIPVGIASSFSKKNLNSNNFNEFNKHNFLKKPITMYINFQKNTNHKERGNIYKLFQDEQWVKIDNPNLSKESYMKNLETSSFVLCPWGNGIDTHRLWETLYAGSIPITKEHITYDYHGKLPILFVNDYSDINYELLSNFLSKFDVNTYNFDLLTKEYWKKTLLNSRELEDEHETYEEKLTVRNFFKIKRFLRKKYNSIVKKFTSFKNKAIRKLGF